MSELIREIEESDLPQVHELVERHIGMPIADIARLGGMTNHSYKVTVENGEEFLVRLPGEGTEELISRSDERKSTELACKLGIDSELLHFGDDGTKVMRFISNPQPMSADVLKKPENLSQAARIFHTLHSCGEDTGVRFEVFEMVELYERVIREANVEFFDDYEDVRATVMRIKSEVDADGEAPRVPCHNDSLVDNWVLDDSGRLFLIDWEYSGMNEAMWDLSCLSIETDCTPENDMELLREYYEREATPAEQRRFAAAKLYVDLLWTLWGLTRVPYDGQFMRDYAAERYERLKANIAAYEKLA